MTKTLQERIEALAEAEFWKGTRDELHALAAEVGELERALLARQGVVELREGRIEYLDTRIEALEAALRYTFRRAQQARASTYKGQWLNALQDVADAAAEALDAKGDDDE